MDSAFDDLKTSHLVAKIAALAVCLRPLTGNEDLAEG
jgi:hypothetical protein